MAKSALKSREEMSADLKASGFDEGQTRGLMQAAADTVAGLDLLTRSEWKQQLDLDRERHQMLLDRLAASEKMLLDRLTGFDKQSRERDEALLGQITEIRETVKRSFLWMRWGLGIFVMLLLFLISGLI